MKVRNITTDEVHEVVNIDKVDSYPDPITVYTLDDNSRWNKSEFWICHVQLAEMTPQEQQK